MEPLKAHLPNLENTPDDKIVYLKCSQCGGEFTRLEESGICQNCEEQNASEKKEHEKRIAFIESRIGVKGRTEFTFNGYKQTAGNKEALAHCRAFNPLGHNLYLWGPCGSGKSHLAGAVFQTRVESGAKCEFIKHPELNRLFRKKEAAEESALLKKFAEREVLVIDDLGVGKSTEFASQILYEILDMRISNYKNGLIITSNLSLDDFAAKVGDDRLPSRIAGICKTVKIEGKDYRLGA